MGTRETSRGTLTLLRRAALREHHDLDVELMRLVASTPSHSFLTNPAAHNRDMYLTALVARYSSAWSGRPFADLDVLDWGCGKGQISYLLKRHGCRVTAADVVSEADDSAFGQDTPILDHLRLQPVPLDDPVRLPFDDTSFDVVLSFGVLEHVADDRGSLGEIARVLRPGGLFFCFELPYSGSWTQRLGHLMGSRYHDRLYTRRRVRNLLAEAGLTINDMWHRQLLPKNRVRYPAFRTFERVDQIVVGFTPMRFLATNLEFIAHRPFGVPYS